MARPATSVSLTDEDRTILTRWVRGTTTEQRLVVRAKIVLAAAGGTATQDIARDLALRPATVSKWRKRYAEGGLAALQDQPRSGRPAHYGEQDEVRILRQLDTKPPPGYAGGEEE